eukprot:4296247-Pleurochrysis_carterae.AAC.1
MQTDGSVMVKFFPLRPDGTRLDAHSCEMLRRLLTEEAKITFEAAATVCAFVLTMYMRAPPPS